jgi:hypothetical protein
MAIDAIKNIQTNTVVQKSKVAFTSDNDTKPEANNTGKALLIAGLAALGAVGIYLVTKGKKVETKPTPETQRPVEQVKDEIKEMTVDAFKKAGNKFEKGIAKLANGENYTGELVVENKKSEKFVLKYNNGLLKNSEKYDSSGKKLYERIYTYNSINKISKIEEGDFLNKKKIFSHDGYGNITSSSIVFYNGDKNSIISVYKKGTLKDFEFVNGKRILRAEINKDAPDTVVFYRNDGTKDFALKKCTFNPDYNDPDYRGFSYDWHGTVEKYDENGDLIGTYSNRFVDEEYKVYRDKYINWCKNRPVTRY